MKKILLLVSQYFFNFLSALFVSALLLMFIMFTVSPALWTGNMAGNNFSDNFGGRLLQFFDNDYIIFFVLPFFPFLALFFVLSVFIWVVYRHDKEAGKIGFQNVILCILSVFILVFLPIKAADVKSRMEEQRNLQISQVYGDGVIYINKNFNKEFLKLYQTLADEGIEAWRKDPVAVVKNELEKGDLTYLSHNENRLTLKTAGKDENTNISSAVIMLENDKLKAEITLHRYWETADGVWLVKSYKKIE
jgi:hypothetical protein